MRARGRAGGSHHGGGGGGGHGGGGAAVSAADAAAQTALDNLRKTYAAAADASLEAMLRRAGELDAVLEDKFTWTREGSLSRTGAFLTGDHKADVETAAKGNARIEELSRLVMDECDVCISHLTKLERWLSLQIPRREDGNNFGVETLESIKAIINERNNALAGFLTDMPNFFISRASTLEKLVGKLETSTTTKTSAVPNVATGENTETSVTNKETSGRVPIDDYLRFIEASDTKHCWVLKDTMMLIQYSYVTIVDMVRKNRDRLDNPRPASSASMMY